MAEFEELLGKLREPGDDGPPETIYDDLAAAYNNVREGADARINELSATVQEKDKKLSQVMSHNYELLTQVQMGNPTGARGDSNKVNEPEEEIEVVKLSDIISYG